MWSLWFNQMERNDFNYQKRFNVSLIFLYFYISSFCTLRTFALFWVVSNPYNLYDFFLVKIFESCTCEHIVVAFFDKKETSFLQAFTVELICIFKNLTNRIYSDVLCQNHLALLFKTTHTESVRKLNQIIINNCNLHSKAHTQTYSQLLRCHCICA